MRRFEHTPRADLAALGRAAAPPGPTRIFLRVTILAADGDEATTLVLPRFPDRAPELEEGLRVVSAYVLRMHDKANREVSKRLH